MTTAPRTRLLVVAGLAALTACASIDPAGAPGPVAEAPEFRAGDRWVIAVEDGFRAPIVWEETHEVTEAGPAGIVVRVRARGPGIDVQRVERWTAPGVVASGAVQALETRRFEPPLLRYRYPLAAGDRWSQLIRDPDRVPGPYGPIDRYTTVGGYERVTTPAGTFDAIRMRVLMRLDDEEFWRTASECNYFVWYAPSIGVAVRETRDCEYREKSDPRVPWQMIPSQRAHLTLVSFVRGR